MWVIVGSSDNAGPNDIIRVEIDINNAFNGVRLCAVDFPMTQGGISKTGYFICVDGKQQSQFGAMVYRCYTKAGNTWDGYPTIYIDSSYTVGRFPIMTSGGGSYAGVVNPISDNQYMPYVAYSGSSVSDAESNSNRKAREYFDTLVHGEGSFSTNIPANGKTLTFTSQATGTIKSVLITGDAAVDVRPS